MSTRRDFIAIVLGAPFAHACSRARPGLPLGELVDTGMVRGHALVRDGRPPPISQWRKHRVVIVGGGVAGLAAGWELRRQGVRDTVILELDRSAGGTARSGSSPVT